MNTLFITLLLVAQPLRVVIGLDGPDLRSAAARQPVRALLERTGGVEVRRLPNDCSHLTRLFKFIGKRKGDGRNSISFSRPPATATPLVECVDRPAVLTLPSSY